MSDATTPVGYPETTAETPADTAATPQAPPVLAGMAPTTPGKSPKVDGRTRLARVFRHTRAHVVEAMGGKEEISPQQAIAIQQLAEAESLRAGLFAAATRGEPMDSEDYARFAKISYQCLKLLGLERKAKRIPSLTERIAQTAGGTSAP